MLAPTTMRGRAQELLAACRAEGLDVTHAALQSLAERRHAGDMPYVEREELIIQAMECYVAEQRGEEMSKDLTPGEARIITRAFLEKNPDATAKEAWEHLKTHGTPSMKAVSFPTTVVTPVKKEMGIGRKKGGKKKGGAKAPRTNGTAPAAKKTTPAAPSQNGTRPKVDDSPAPAAEVVHPTAAPDGDDDDRDRIDITTPGGQLRAQEEKRGYWLVEFRGSVETDLLRAMVADLVGPITAPAADA